MHFEVQVSTRMSSSYPTGSASLKKCFVDYVRSEFFSNLYISVIKLSVTGSDLCLREIRRLGQLQEKSSYQESGMILDCFANCRLFWFLP